MQAVCKPLLADAMTCHVTCPDLYLRLIIYLAPQNQLLPYAWRAEAEKHLDGALINQTLRDGRGLGFDAFLLPHLS
jgi:hypothetical protein